MLAILEETPLKKIPSRKIPLSEGEDSDRSCRAQRWKQRRSSICKNGDPNASGDYESRNTRLQEVMVLIEELVKQIPMAEKLLEIKGVGIRQCQGSLQK